MIIITRLTIHLTSARRILLIPLLLLLGLGCRTASADDKGSVRKLSELCKVWGEVKLFNPYASNHPAGWDSVLLATIPKVLKATTSAELSSAYASMFATLPNAFARLQPLQAQSKGDHRATQEVKISEANGKLIIQVGSLDNLSPSRIIQRVQPEKWAKPLVLDLRSSDFGASETAVEDSLRLLLESVYANTPQVLPASRRIVYNGYTPQGEGGSEMYAKTYEYLDKLRTLTFSGNVPLMAPITFVINEGSRGTSRIIGALSYARQARVIVEGKVPLESGLKIKTGKLSSGAEFEYPVTENSFYGGSDGFIADTFVQEFDNSIVTAYENSGYWKSMQSDMIPAYREVEHTDKPYETVEMRLLTLFRLWTTIEYFYPYKHLMDIPWSHTLSDMIPVFMDATDQQSFTQAILRTAARIQDDHVFTGHDAIWPLIGQYSLPISVTFSNNQLIVDYVDTTSDAKHKVNVGDRIESIDGIGIDSLRSKYSHYVAASTSVGRDAKIISRLLGTNAKSKTLRVFSAEGIEKTVTVRTYGYNSYRHRPDDSADVHRSIDESLGIHYINFVELNKEDVAKNYEKVRNSSWLILDVRGYPKGTMRMLSALLASKQAKVANYKFLRLADPDSINNAWKSSEEILRPTANAGYKGRIILLVNGNAISQSEHSCLFFKALGNTTVIGSASRGANGDITNTLLPGGYRMSFTGLSVTYPDGSELQRRGILPDIHIEPTQKDIKDGNDAVLNRAVQYIRAEEFARSRSK